MGSEDPWYVEAFRLDYALVYAHRDLESARIEAGYLVDRGVGGRVLDLCCGFGRHALALRERGVDAFGSDLSRDLLGQARSLPGAALLVGRLSQADARRLPFGDSTLDSVVSLFSSFGYFGDDGDREVVDGIARVLVRGGLFVLDLMNPPRVRAGLVAESTRTAGPFTIVESRSLSDAGRRVVKQVRLRGPTGAERTWREEVRMYEHAEMVEMLERAGLRTLGVHGDFGAAAFTPDSPRQIVAARKL